MTSDSTIDDALWESLPRVGTSAEAELHSLFAVNKGLNVWGAIYAEFTWAL
jgi:hypothetical protein